MKVDPLDKMVSEFARRRAIKRVGGCERCLHPKFDIQKDNGDILPAWKQLQCSHFFGRGSKSVRFDEFNVLGLCGACHMLLEHHPSEHTEWFKNYIGEAEYDMLQARARTPARYLDKKLLELYYRDQIEKMNEFRRI